MSELRNLSLEELDELERQILSRPPPPPLSLGEPVGFGGRLLAAFGRTPQGKENILKSQGIKGTLRDPVGFDIGDIADIAGDIPPALASAIGTILTKSATGAGFGAMVGEKFSQKVGSILGSQEEEDVGAQAMEGVAGFAGEGVFGGGLKKLANPLRRFATTSNIEQNVIGPARKFGVEEALLPGSRTESQFVNRAQARIGAGASPEGEQFRNVTREAFREAEDKAFGEIAKKGGVSLDLPTPGADTFIEAGAGARTQRLEVIGELFDKAREAIPDPDKLPIVIDQTMQAMNRMVTRSKAGALPTQNITASARKQIASLREDVASIQNFRQLDAFRQKIGDMLKNRPLMEELEKAGGDVDFRDLYGGLARDLDASLDEGFLAREFGGQTKGVVGREGIENVNRMQRGELGERGLPTFEGRPGQVARGQVPARPPPGEQRISDDLLDEMGGRIDKARSLRGEASDRFKDILSLDSRTIVNMLKDPGQAENVFKRLFRPGGSRENLRVFREIIGESPTAGGAAATAEGKEAWAQVQSQVLREVKEAGQDALANRLPGGVQPLKGADMRKKLDALGGRELMEEAFGKSLTDDLYDFADFVREAAPEERSFARIPAGAETPQDIGIFFITWMKKAGQLIFDKVAGKAGFPGQGMASRALTTGLAPTSTRQGVLGAIGAFGGQPTFASGLGLLSPKR